MTGCTDITANNYDSTAQCDDGSCCYSSSPTLSVTISGNNMNYGSQWSGTFSHLGWELQNEFGSVIASGGSVTGESWNDSTNYNYCLPMNDSCTKYSLVLYDNWCYGWSYEDWDTVSWNYYIMPSATALITGINGDTLFSFMPDTNNYWWCNESFGVSLLPQGCMDPIANKLNRRINEGASKNEIIQEINILRNEILDGGFKINKNWAPENQDLIDAVKNTKHIYE